MSDLSALLSSQISESTKFSSQQIDIRQIELFVRTTGKPIAVRYGDNLGNLRKVNISELPNPQPILKLFSKQMRNTLSEVSLPKNCVFDNVSLIPEQQQIEMSLWFQIPLSYQKPLLSFAKQLVPNNIFRTEQLHFILSTILFDERDISSVDFSFITQNKQLFENPPNQKYIETIIDTEDETDTGAILGGSNPIWGWGDTKMDYPFYRLTYRTRPAKQTLQTTVHRLLDSLLSGFTVPDNYDVTWRVLHLTNGKSSGQFMASISAPYTPLD
jgi:hypothetical protein